MYVGKTLFAQLMDFLPWKRFHRIVGRRGGDRYVKSLSCAQQFRVMAFAQFSYRESLRDIEACLAAQTLKSYHMGLTGPIRRSTLADANERRDWRIFAEFAQCLMSEARTLYAQDAFGIELIDGAYALDSTTIDLSLSLFPWAHFRAIKSAVKMHTLLDLRGNIPSFIHISNGKLADVKLLDRLPLEAGATYVMDRGYLDFSRLYRLHQASALFVTRAKSNTLYRRVRSNPVDEASRAEGILRDQAIRLSGKTSRMDYPERLRRIECVDADSGKMIVILTNQLGLPATTIAALYKARWRVELFFKWIKQHLRIKKFYGNSENAVKSQIWIAVSVYLLIAIVKKRLDLSSSLYSLLQVISLTLFEKMSLQHALHATNHQAENAYLANQLNLFEF